MSFIHTLSRVASVAVIAGAALVAIPSVAVAAPAAANAADSCIPAGGGIGTGDPNPIDAQANVYVGGDFLVLKGAELEGQLVVRGDASFAAPLANANGLYNLGVAGVGSLLTPPAMSDMLVVGGDLTVEPGRSLEVGHKIGGGVRVGGGISAAPKAIETNGGALVSGIGREAALAERAGLGTTLAQQSSRYAAMQDTGTSRAEWGTLTLTGDGTSARQVFTLDAAEAAKATSLRYKNIDPKSVVVVNVRGASATFDLKSVLGADETPLDGGAAFAELTQRLMWNFPDTSDVVIGSMAQFPGSVLVANPASTTTVKLPGTNGRLWVAGNLVHDFLGGEFHAFPFLDDEVFGCDPTPPTVELVSPRVTQAACTTEGRMMDPKVVLPVSTKLDYSLEGKVAAGETVTVTATSLSETKIAPTPGWELAQNARSATQGIELEDVVCEEPFVPAVSVTPVTPTVTQAVCTADGTATEPAIALAETEGITYTATGDTKAGGSVTVTATADEGKTLTEAEGWTLADDTQTATIDIVLDDVVCEEPFVPAFSVTPVTPTVTQAVCTADGTATEPAIALAETEGITYATTGDTQAGGTVTVTATPAAGFTLTEADGWELTADGARTVLSLDAPLCESTPEKVVSKPTPDDAAKQSAPAAVPAAALAESGAAPLAGIGIGAAALALVGLCLLLGTRARGSRRVTE